MGKAGGGLRVVYGSYSEICRHVLGSLRKSSYRNYVCGYLSRHLTSTIVEVFPIKRCFDCLSGCMMRYLHSHREVQFRG